MNTYRVLHVLRDLETQRVLASAATLEELRQTALKRGLDKDHVFVDLLREPVAPPRDIRPRDESTSHRA